MKHGEGTIIHILHARLQCMLDIHKPTLQLCSRYIYTYADTIYALIIPHLACPACVRKLIVLNQKCTNPCPQSKLYFQYPYRHRIRVSQHCLHRIACYSYFNPFDYLDPPLLEYNNIKTTKNVPLPPSPLLSLNTHPYPHNRALRIILHRIALHQTS
jgi:hypothetical protein